MSIENLQAENAELRRRLEEAEETIRAIQEGAVDAFVVEEGAGHRVYTLEAADRPYRLFVEQMQQGAATLNAKGTIACCNRQLADLLGVRPEKLVGASFEDFVADEDRASFERLYREGRTRSGSGEARLQRADRKLVPTILTFNVLSKEFGAGTGVLVTDLTMQRHQEKLAAALHALSASEERFRMVADNISHLAWTCDRLGHATWYNQRWLDYTGLAFEEMKGWDWSKVQHPDHLERVVARVRRSAETGEPWEDTFPLRRKDGCYRWFLSRATPIRDPQGDIVCWFGTNTDVTEQRAAEEALREADRRKDEFLAMLAHELRGPLAPLGNMLEIIKRADGDAELLRQARLTMERQLGQIVRLVDDLLDVGRITRDMIELRKERIDLAVIVQQAVEASRALCDSLGHELTITLPPDPVHVHGDPTRLTQVLVNLLNNACKFTDRGSRIWLSVDRVGERAVLSVRDTGIGIAPEELDRSFQAFAQVDPSLERVRDGLGLGLALVKKLVELHGGTVEARSAGLGRGSEFVVRLPVIPTPRPALPREPARIEPGPTVPRRILVVDDNRDSADSLALLLKLMGHEVATAHDGLEAVERSTIFRADVVLLDIGMPGLNGHEVARRIGEQAGEESPRLVALTGWGHEDDRRRSKDAGFEAHLVKPVDLAVLKKLLVEWGAG